MAQPTAVKVFTLVCHRDVQLASRCLASFARHCRDPIKLIGIDDGSLTAEDRRTLEASVPGLTIPPSAELSARIEPVLSEYPRSASYRGWCPWAFKLFDIPLYADGDYVYVDGDVLFLRDFSGLGGLGRSGADVVSMQSYANIYSFASLNRVMRRRSLPVIERVNSGFMFVRECAFDLDLIERFLQEAENDPRPYLWEQTAWAVVAAHCNSTHFDARQIAFPQTALHLDWSFKWQPVAMHFVGGTRHLVDHVRAAAVAQPVSDVVALGFDDAKLLTRPGLLLDLCRHRWNLKRWRARKLSVS